MNCQIMGLSIGSSKGSFRIHLSHGRTLSSEAQSLKMSQVKLRSCRRSERRLGTTLRRSGAYTCRESQATGRKLDSLDAFGSFSIFWLTAEKASLTPCFSTREPDCTTLAPQR